LQGSPDDPVDQALLDELWELQHLQPARVYELLRQRFANDAAGTARLCQLALTDALGHEEQVVLVDGAFLGAAFAAWLDAINSPTDVLAAVLALVPEGWDDRRSATLPTIASSLAKRDEGLPQQPDGQQRALVHALVVAVDHHRNRLGTGIVVAHALGLAIDHDPTAQAALIRLARSTERRIQQIAWGGLATELPPAALLAVLDEPLPLIPDDHDARRVRAVLASVRNAPEQRSAVHRWLGARLVDLARQSRWDVDPRNDPSRVHWFRRVSESLSDADQDALQLELQVLAEGRGDLGRFARRLLAPR